MNWRNARFVPSAMALTCLAVIIVCDGALQRLNLPYLVQAMFDEPAHAATTLLLLLALPFRLGKRFIGSALLASVLIDADHLPIVLGIAALSPHSAHRPYTHSLATVVVVLLLSSVVFESRREYGTGAAVGLLAHFFRDTATNFVPLFWPVSGREVGIPYQFYAASIALLFVAAVAQNRRLAGTYIPHAPPGLTVPALHSDSWNRGDA